MDDQIAFRARQRRRFLRSDSQIPSLEALKALNYNNDEPGQEGVHAGTTQNSTGGSSSRAHPPLDGARAHHGPHKRHAPDLPGPESDEDERDITLSGQDEPAEPATAAVIGSERETGLHHAPDDEDDIIHSVKHVHDENPASSSRETGAAPTQDTPADAAHDEKAGAALVTNFIDPGASDEQEDAIETLHAYLFRDGDGPPHPRFLSDEEGSDDDDSEVHDAAQLEDAVNQYLGLAPQCVCRTILRTDQETRHIIVAQNEDGTDLTLLRKEVMLGFFLGRVGPNIHPTIRQVRLGPRRRVEARVFTAFKEHNLSHSSPVPLSQSADA